MHPRFCAALLALGLAAAIPAAAQTGPDQPRILTMTGQGTVLAAPDTATLSAGVTSTGASAAAALSANSGRMSAVMAALKAQGVPASHIQTGNFSVSPQYANDDAGHITGYQVTNQVTVRLDDVARLGSALDALVQAGANRVDNVGFSIRDSAALLDQARARAVDDARAKAQTYAKAAGVTLGPILSISENGSAAPRPVFAAAPMMAMARAVPVAEGEQRVTAEVAIVWEIQ